MLKSQDLPLDVGCQGFIGQTVQPSHSVVLEQQKAMKELGEEAEKTRFCLWVWRKDGNWWAILKFKFL